MKGPTLSERTVKCIVLATSILGILLLSVLAYTSEVEEVPISSIKEKEGETVLVKGWVYGSSATGSGERRLMINDGNSSLEVFVERSSSGIDIGSRISAKGDVIRYGRGYILTVQSDRAVEVIENREVPEFSGIWNVNGVQSFTGTVSSVSNYGWNTLKMTLWLEPSNSSDTEYLLEAEIEECSVDIRPGDVVSVSGLVLKEGQLLGFGEEAMEVLSRTEPRTLGLLRLIDEMRLSPSGAPKESVTLEGYLKYEPTGTSMYLSDEPEGSEISVKTKLPQDYEPPQKGDLIRASNCSLEWDETQLRYCLCPASVSVVRSYGTWYLNLEELEYGLSGYENAAVALEGSLEETGGKLYLVTGDRSVEVRSVNLTETAGTVLVQGRVRFDDRSNCFFLEEGADL